MSKHSDNYVERSLYFFLHHIGKPEFEGEDDHDVLSRSAYLSRRKI
jgi:hypothetical protein